MRSASRVSSCFLNVAMSLDGKIASVSREMPSFPSREDRRTMDRIRARSDAILIGSGTLRAADFPLRIRSRALQRRRLLEGRPAQPLNVLISASLDVPLNGRFFSDPEMRRIVFTSISAPYARRRMAGEKGEVIAWKSKKLDLVRLVRELRRRGVREILLEGGGATNFEFFRRGLVDEIYLTLSPVIIGGAGSPTPVDGEGFDAPKFPRFIPVRIRRVGDELFLHYRRR